MISFGSMTNLVLPNEARARHDRSGHEHGHGRAVINVGYRIDFDISKRR